MMHVRTAVNEDAFRLAQLSGVLGYPVSSDAMVARLSRVLARATDVLFEVRKQRSEAKQPMRVPITKVTVTADSQALALMPAVEADLRSALRVNAFETIEGEPRTMTVHGYETGV